MHALIGFDGVVCQTADAIFPVNDSLVWVDIQGINPQPDVGWSYSGGAFTAPPPPVVDITSTHKTPLEFMARFTSDEQMAIATAAMANAGLFLWFNKLTAATFVDLLDPETQSGLAALVSANLITSDRATAILTP